MRSLHARHRCGRAAHVCPYGCGALRRFYKFHFIQKPRAESIFPQTCEISRLGKVVRYPREVAFSRRRLLVYFTGRRLRNSKKRCRRNFESGLQLIFLCTMSASRVFSVNLRNTLLGQSRAIPATWRFPPVGCLFTSQVAVCAIVKNVADAIFNRGLQLICLCTMSAPRVFSVNLQNAPLGQSRAIPATWRFPAVGCLFTPQVAVCAIVKKMSQTLILNC